MMLEHEAARIGGVADDGGVQAPLLEDGVAVLLATGLQDRQHALLAFGEHELVGVHASLAHRHLVQFDDNAEAALGRHLALDPALHPPMAGVEQEDAVVHQLLLGQLLAVVFALDQPRQHVVRRVAGVGAAFAHQLAQVGQAHFQFAQLDVVEAVGGLLAVAGDEGHGGAAIQQLHGRFDLGGANLQFGGQLQQDLVQGRSRCGRQRGACRERTPGGEAVCHSPCAAPMPPLARPAPDIGDNPPLVLPDPDRPPRPPASHRPWP